VTVSELPHDDDPEVVLLVELTGNLITARFQLTWLDNDAPTLEELKRTAMNMTKAAYEIVSGEDEETA